MTKKNRRRGLQNTNEPRNMGPDRGKRYCRE
jgi:hypothetical protein